MEGPVDIKYRIPKQGKYNTEVYDCPDCDVNIHTDRQPIGWFMLEDEWMVMWECPKCFENWYHHDRDLFYYRHFLLNMTL